eukprot:COSAG05_NODE_1869_length_3926_cov_16.772145_2_plen_51_part_00
MIAKNSAYDRNKGRANPGQIGAQELIQIFDEQVCNQTEFEMCDHCEPRCI